MAKNKAGIKNAEDRNILNHLLYSLTLDEKIQTISLTLQETPDDASLPGGLPKEVVNLYKQIDGCKLEWEHEDFPDNPAVKGICRLLSAKEISLPTEGVVWFNDPPTGDPIRKFAIIDFFVNEACVGVYKDSDDPALYYYDFEDKPQSLQLDMNGYITMLAEARGFWYWQLVLLDILSGEEHTETKSFKLYMPKIFPDFSFNEFASRYQKVKLA